MPLFDRIGHSIALTEEGEIFLPNALNTLKEEEAARNSVHLVEENLQNLMRGEIDFLIILDEAKE